MKAALHNVCRISIALALLSGSLIAQTVSEDIEHVSTITEGIAAPLRLASDSQGSTYVTDASTKSIYKFDTYGNVTDTISAVKTPVSVAADDEGRLFIGDGMTGNIYVYEGNSVTMFFDSTIYPTSMVFGANNTLYVSDSKLQKVLALDISANVIQTIGEGVVDFPTGIAYDSNNDRILVGEHGGSGTGFKPTVKVYMFNTDGSLYKSFGSHGNGDGQFYRIQGITVGKCGNIYVVDPFQSRISIFNEEGVFITKFGDFGAAAGQMNIPMDLAFDMQERILVSSMNNGNLELFSVNDTLPTSNILSGDVMICSGESTDIEIALSGTAPWNFTYTRDGLNPTVINTAENPCVVTVSDPGHYEVVALSDANYDGTCFTGGVEVIVSTEIPTASISGDTSICTGEAANISVDLSGEGPWKFTYTKDGTVPIIIETNNNPHIINVSDAGLYQISSLEGGGCIGSEISGSANIIVNPLPTATISEGNSLITLDSGLSTYFTVELTGTAPFDISYYIDEANPSIITDVSDNTYALTTSLHGTYDVFQVIDANLCSNTRSSGFPEIIFKSPGPFPTAKVYGGSYSICPEDYIPILIEFTGTPPWTFTFKVDTLLSTTIFNTYTNPYIVNGIYSGTYEVTALSDANYQGNEFEGSSVVSYFQKPVTDYTYSVENLDVNFMNSTVDADAFFWEFGDGSTSTDINPFHQYDAAGEYEVTLTAALESCVDSTITKSIKVGSVYTENIHFEDLCKIYPNPSKGSVNIEFGKSVNEETSIEIIDIGGKVVYHNDFITKNEVVVVDLGSYQAGLYLVKLVSSESSYISKLVLYKE